MSTDHALLGMAVVSGLFGFLLGYARGHENGKYAGRIALRREQAAQRQVSR